MKTNVKITPERRKRHLLLDLFFIFYQEIATIKLALAKDPAKILPANYFKGEKIDFSILAAYINRRFERHLHTQYDQVKDQLSQFELEVFNDARYVMAALVDEMFILNIPWSGKEYWNQHSLERRLFNSDNAGRIFFSKLEKLLEDKVQDEISRDLGGIYLLALQMGFEGEFRGAKQRNDETAALIKYRKPLEGYIGQQVQPNQRLFDRAYDYNISELTDFRLAPLRPWFRRLAVVATVYFMASVAIWEFAIFNIGYL